MLYKTGIKNTNLLVDQYEFHIHTFSTYVRRVCWTHLIRRVSFSRQSKHDFISVNIYSYKVYKVTPAEDTHAQLLEDLKGHPDVDFWNEQRNLNEVVDIMVSPLFKTEFEEILTLHGIIYTTMFDNLETYYVKPACISDLRL